VLVAVPDEFARGNEGEVRYISGGATRAESVLAGLEHVETEYVVVHDAARPLAESALFDAVLARLVDDGAEGVIAAMRVTDTTKQVREGEVVERTLDRSTLWAAQTPQAFRTEALREAISAADSLADATDEAMLVERNGGRVVVHEAAKENIKVTTAFDLRVAEILLTARS
jgi:2-C-methyl-D-erythritol 4-phosphate cytidylyltransferase